jgi:adenylate cyclase class 2
MADYNETEIKLYVPDLDAVKGRLKAAGAILRAERVYERNVRHENAERNLHTRGLTLRLRQDTRVRLTYKDSPRNSDDSGIHSRLEIEVEVSDFDAMEAMLEKLGYFPHMVYEKYRTTYELDGTEIVLDELPYGNFVEIEGEVQAIQAVIGRLELHSAARFGGSYATLFERVKNHLGLMMNDLTFENFKDIHVPESAFRSSSSE